jgi:predicted DNA-binding protein
MPDELKKLRGDHCLNVFVSYELKQRIVELADRYDRTMADMVRALIKVGLPVMEGISKAEEEMLNEYVRLFRKMRKMRELKASNRP